MSTNLESGVELRLRFALDQELHYAFHSRLYQEVRDGDKVVSQESSELPASMVWRVLRVDPDGSGHLLVTTTPTEANRLELRSVVYQHLSPRGEILEVTGPNPGSTFSFPLDPVGIGGSWSGVVRGHVPGRSYPLQTTFHYKVGGMEKRSGYDCLNIELESDEVTLDMPRHEVQKVSRLTTRTFGRMYFAPDPGIMVRLEAKSITRPELGTLVSETHNTLTQELLRVEG